MFRIHAEFTKCVHRTLSDFMCWHFRYKRGIHAIIRQRNCNICFSSSIAYFEFFCLNKSAIAFWIQTHHNFTKCNNSFHLKVLLLHYCHILFGKCCNTCIIFFCKHFLINNVGTDTKSTNTSF